MVSHTHPPEDAPSWEHPDFCPFCGVELEAGAASFMDHVEATPDCRKRFEAWQAAVREDIEGEWSG
ncbi:MAG: hypothetical protein ABEJ58_08525 [Halodesulfurarchaeum sp.]